MRYPNKIGIALIAVICTTCLFGCETLSDLLNYPKQIISGQATGEMAIGQYRSAIAKFDTAISLNAKDRNTFFYRGICYCQLGEFDKAIEDFSKAISFGQSGNEITPSLNYRSYCHLQIGQIEKALADCNRAITIGPTFSTYYNLALIYTKQQNFKKVVEVCSQGLLAFKLPSDQRYLEAPFFEARAFAYNKLGKYKQSLTDSTQAIAYNNARKALSTNTVNAIDFGIRIADCYIPADFNIFALRASVHLQLKQPDQAIADCNLGIAENKMDAEAYHYRAIAYKELGKDQLAKNDDAKAAELGFKHS